MSPMPHLSMRRVSVVLTLLATVACLNLAAIVLAEVPNRSPEWLRERATHVVTGEIAAIYERKSTEGNFKVRRCIAEVRLKSVEKGEALAPGDVIYVRYFHRSQRAFVRIADTNGHRGLAKEGESLRIYLARNAGDGFNSAEENADGGYNVVFPNGFERLAKDLNPSAQAQP